MRTSDILRQLETLGVTITSSGDKLRLKPASRVPPQLMEALRRDKTEVMAYLHKQSDGIKAGYELRYSGSDRKAELDEIERVVAQDGYVLLWSAVLEDLIAFYKSQGDRLRIPPGFVAYSTEELWRLFGDEDYDISREALLRIHEAKKTGAEIIDVREDQP